MNEEEKPKGYEDFEYADFNKIQAGTFLKPDNSGLILRGVSGDADLPFNENYYERTGEENPKKKIIDASAIFTTKGQVEEFYEKVPFFYDRTKMFWLWEEDEKRWILSDEVDLLNKIGEHIGVDTLNSKRKAEIVSGLQQLGRKKMPKNPSPSWVQFQDKIYDFKTKELFDSSHEYFITNPIPWEIGESEETPTIDKLFDEWVGEDYKKTLYQIIAYCCSSEQFMQRLVALTGGGANGKGTFIQLVKKFLGYDNIASSELKELSGNQFETSAIYRKLLCVMGEVSYDDLKNTNQIKKLAGEDEIRYCFKGKTPFTEKSITTLISATNSLPRTPDKTLGFYRKWLIIDFPNQFPIKSGILESIPDYEFNNLANKVTKILTELWEQQKFHNEGTFEERSAKYEERSNPVLSFIEKYCDENHEEKTEFREFVNIFNDFAKQNHLRPMTARQVGMALREEGFEMGKRTAEHPDGSKTSKQYILNLTLNYKKNTENTENTEISTDFSRREFSANFGIFGISGIFDNEKVRTFCGKSFTLEKIGLNLICGQIGKAGFDKVPCPDCYLKQNKIEDTKENRKIYIESLEGIFGTPNN